MNQQDKHTQEEESLLLDKESIESTINLDSEIHSSPIPIKNGYSQVNVQKQPNCNKTKNL